MFPQVKLLFKFKEEENKALLKVSMVMKSQKSTFITTDTQSEILMKL